MVPVILLAGLYALVRFEIIDDLPSQTELQGIENPHASSLYAADSSLLARYYIENRTNLQYGDLTDFYKNALVATEDIRFFRHHGVDMRSLLRVLVKSILMQQRSSGGGSTITQQLIKNLYPREDYLLFPMLINKLREMCIARDIEKVYSKDQILLMYSNTVSFGELAFGLGTASERFFSKRPADLLPEEAATLVGILKAPSYYSPRVYPERSLQRRNVVLAQMARYGFLDEQDAAELIQLPLSLNYQPPAGTDEMARYFKRQVSREFDSWKVDFRKEDGTLYNLYRDGLKIYTSLDPGMQRAAERIVKRHMRNLQRLFLESWSNGRLYGPDTRIIDDGIKRDPLYASLKQSGTDKEDILTAFTTPAERTLWTWEGEVQRRCTKIDSIKHYLSLLHAGLVAVDPQTGQIKVWVGGNDYNRFQIDNILAGRHVGSVFKPIVYLTALEKGIDPCAYYPNERKVYARYKDWSPQNADGEYGGHLSVQEALAHSVNTVSVQILFETGVPDVVAMARKLGITSRLEAVPSIVLGTSDIPLLEMIRGYATIANRGIPSEIHAITRIEDHLGNVLYQRPSPDALDPVVESRHIEVLNAMLWRVTREGTGRRLYSSYDIPFPVMGKTGTTQNQSDGLFIGYTDRLLVGTWVGAYDRRIHFRNLATGSGGRTALPMAGALFEYAAAQGYRPDQIQTDTIQCPDYVPDEAFIRQQLDRIARSIDSLRDVTRANLRDARRDRAGINRRNREAWEKADRRVQQIKHRADIAMDDLRRKEDHWKDLLRKAQSDQGFFERLFN